MPILVSINIQKYFLLTSDNCFYCLTKRLWAVFKPALKFLNILGAHWSKCPHIPKGQSKLGLKPCRKKKKEGLTFIITWWSSVKNLGKWNQPKGLLLAQWVEDFFLHIIGVCHLLSLVSGHIYPIGTSFIHSIHLNVREFIGEDKFK